ncbi:MAG TPA: amidohydrolase family protein [Thermoleophilaceae bacterium]
MFAATLILPWLELLRREIPGVELFDVHTHIGRNDPDGYRCEPEELIEALEEVDARGVVFPMHEPDGYPPANDEVLRAAAASGGRLVPFCRLDPEDDPVAEAERCLDAGARGIKFHPRAEAFTLDHPKLRDVFALADERRVPVLTHAGRGIPALGRHAVDACERHPGMNLILAHAGISDLAWIWSEAQTHPNLFFDTSWWSAADLIALFSLVPPGQILMGSDAPYGTPAFAATMSLRYSIQVGLSADQARSIAGGQLARLVAGEPARDMGPAPGPPSAPPDPLLDRLYTFLVSALGQMFNGVDPAETLALAALACEVGDDAPQAPVCRSILGLLEMRSRYRSDGQPRPPRFAPGIQFVVVAAALARTPGAPLPPEPVEVDLSERARGAFHDPALG